jgi:S1-C subfamily serine protease
MTVNIIKNTLQRFLLVLFLISTYSNCIAQSLRNINLNKYKYIIIDEISGKNPGETRRFTVKNLQKAGYNVVNLSNPLKTHEKLPSDLDQNKNLGLFLSVNTGMQGCYVVSISLYSNKNQLLLERTGTSCGLLSTAVKMAISSLTNYDYKFDESIVKEEQNDEDKVVSEGNDWLGNGSGFFIDKNGYIATNYHVILKAKEIEVEFNRDGVKQVYNATVIQSDKQNDISILKINSKDFLPLKELPYYFKTEPTDIGSSIFSLGYPMALSLMGTDIKFTDGKISSKTGFQGDITSYQISVPIQPGNSGGPLFDYDGNLIGITSSGVNRELNITENVNYAIKASYLKNLVEVLDSKLELPTNQSLSSKSLTEKIKVLSDYVVLIKTR